MWTVASRMSLQPQPTPEAAEYPASRPFGMRFVTYSRGRRVLRPTATVCPKTQLGFIDGAPVLDSGDTYCNDSDGQDVLVTDTEKDD